MVLRVDGRQNTQGAEDRGQQDVSTGAKKSGEGHSRARNDQAAQAAEDQQFDVSSPRRSRPATVASTSSPPAKAARALDSSTRSASPAKPVRSHGHSYGNNARSGGQPETPADHRPQLDAATAVFASLPRPGAVGRPAPISTNDGGSSPTQDQPRGWQAMLQSPTQHGDQVMSDREQHVSAEPGQEPLPVLSPAADDEPVRQSPFGSSAAPSGVAPAPAGRVSACTGRPSPLVLPGESTVSPASRLHNLRLVSPAAGAPPIRPPAMVRMELTIQPPPSPRDSGCVTPTAMHSPSRPYHGPHMSEAEVDYDLIDGIALADGSTPNSSGSSPSLTGAAGSAVYTRNGGLRSSRDTDLRRVAMANQLLHSPRPPNSVSGGGSQPMFASDTRARAIAAGAPPTARDSGSEPVAQPAGDTTAVLSSETPPPTATQLQRLYQQSMRSSQVSSPASAASPAGPSILAGASGARSLPGTPGAAHPQRSNSGAPVPISSSRSSSMTASPVPPPTHGPAAALLAGAVGASPSTPRSPLSVMYSPYSGRTVFSSGGASLPPPLFSAVNSGSGSGAAGSPLPAAAGSAALPPSGRSSTSNIAMFSPPATSRLRREFSGPVPSQELPPAPPASGLGGETSEPLQPMDVDGEHQLQQPPQQRPPSHPTPMDLSSEELAAQGLSALCRQGSLQQLSVPEHYPQVLRHRLQVTDTRFGPHGESPLSPSHHSHMQHMQQQSHGESLLSPTRPTPLVQPALAAAAAVSGMPDAAAAASAPAAGDAAGDAVGVVGRRDVHEWLDQHSWPFLYELPHNLRDAADFTRSQRLGRTQADPGDAAVHDHVAASRQQEQNRPAEHTNCLLGTTSGEQLEQLTAHLEAVGVHPDGLPAVPRSAGQQSDLASFVEPGSTATPTAGASDWAPHASRHQARLADLVSGTAVPSIASIPPPALGPSSSRPLDWAFGGLRVSVDQSGPTANSLGSSSASRFGPQTHPGPSIFGSARGEGSVSGRSRPGSVLSRHSASSIGDVCAPGDVVGAQVVADRAVAGQAGPASTASMVQAGFSKPEAPADSPISSAAVEPDSDVAHGGVGMSGSTSASARLLSPGSHLYMPGSPVAENSCCCSCPAVPLGMQVGLPAAALLSRDDLALHSSSTNSATAAAELLRSSMAAVAATQDGVPELNRPSSITGRYRRRSTHGDIQSTEQTGEPTLHQSTGLVTDLPGADSVVDAGMLELSPATPALQSDLWWLGRASAPQRRQQQLTLQIHSGAPAAASAEAPAAATVQAVPAAAPGSMCSKIDAAGVMSLICDQLLQQSEGAATSCGHDVVGTSARQLSLGNSAVLLALLSNQRYMHQLLSALPGVDPQAPEVQHAVRQLQKALQQQSGVDPAVDA